MQSYFDEGFDSFLLNIDQINISAADAEAIPRAIDEIREVLRERHKLEADPTRPRYLITEPGVGYRLKIE